MSTITYSEPEVKVSSLESMIAFGQPPAPKESPKKQPKKVKEIKVKKDYDIPKPVGHNHESFIPIRRVEKVATFEFDRVQKGIEDQAREQTGIIPPSIMDHLDNLENPVDKARFEELKNHAVGKEWIKSQRAIDQANAELFEKYFRLFLKADPTGQEFKQKLKEAKPKEQVADKYLNIISVVCSNAVRGMLRTAYNNAVKEGVKIIRAKHLLAGCEESLAREFTLSDETYHLRRYFETLVCDYADEFVKDEKAPKRKSDEAEIVLQTGDDEDEDVYVSEEDLLKTGIDKTLADDLKIIQQLTFKHSQKEHPSWKEEQHQVAASMVSQVKLKAQLRSLIQTVLTEAISSIYDIMTNIGRIQSDEESNVIKVDINDLYSAVLSIFRFHYGKQDYMQFFAIFKEFSTQVTKDYELRLQYRQTLNMHVYAEKNGKTFDQVRDERVERDHKSLIKKAGVESWDVYLKERKEREEAVKLKRAENQKKLDAENAAKQLKKASEHAENVKAFVEIKSIITQKFSEPLKVSFPTLAVGSVVIKTD